MTNRLMETACARLCLLTPIAWDESMPPLFSRMAVRRMMECGALGNASHPDERRAFVFGSL